MKKLLIILLSLVLIATVALVSCEKENSEETKNNATTNAATETEKATEAETDAKDSASCTVSVKLDNGDSVSGAKFTLTLGEENYDLVSGEDGTVKADLPAGTYSISYDYDSLPSGCYPYTETVEIAADTTEILLTIVDNNPNGTAEKPFFISEDVTAVSVEAGGEVHYVYRGAAMRYLTIENEGVSVTYKDTEYKAENGKVTVLITPQMGEMTSFFVKNNTDAKIETSMSLVSPEGSMENPYDFEGNSADISVPAGEAVYYEYVAEKNGILVVSSASELNNIALTNTNTYAVTSFTAGAAGTYMLVSEGDSVIIAVSSTDAENEAVIDVAVNCYSGTDGDAVPVVTEFVEISLPAGAAVTFFAETGKTVGLSNPSVTLTVGDKDYTPTDDEAIALTLEGEGETVLFAISNNSEGMISVSFGVN